MDGESYFSCVHGQLSLYRHLMRSAPEEMHSIFEVLLIGAVR